jgi:uncharacterized protein
MATRAPTLEDYRQAIVDWIVPAVHPRRIIVFGSAARGEMGPESDIDLLVIMPDGTHRRRTAMDLYARPGGPGVAVDIVVATDSDVRNYGGNWSLVLYPALREGVEICAADR